MTQQIEPGAPRGEDLRDKGYRGGGSGVRLRQVEGDSVTITPDR